MKWPKGLALILGLAFVVWCSGCSKQSASQDTQKKGSGKSGAGAGGRPIPVGVADVQKRDVPVILSGLGTIVPYNTVTVRSRVDGQLVKVNFKEGQDVKAGELLAVIDPRPFEVALQQAQAALSRDQSLLRTSQVNLQRFEKLATEGVVAQQQLDQQKAETGQFTGTVQLDQAAVDNARLNLSYTQIKAPLSGRVGLRLVDLGNMVHASDANGMLVITEVQPIAVLFTLPEDQIPQVVARMKTGSLQVQAYDRDDKNLLATGKLETLDNSIDTTTGTVRLKGVFDNRDGALWPNQFVNVHLGIQTLQGATVVPSSAIQHGQQNVTFVYVVDNTNTAQIRNVQLRLTQGDIAVVASGVSPGDKVVTDGQDRLQAGMKVEPTAGLGHQQQNAGAPTGNNNGSGLGPNGGPGGHRGSSQLPDTNQPAPGSAMQPATTPPNGDQQNGQQGHGHRGGH